jgi:hypothetical protein
MMMEMTMVPTETTVRRSVTEPPVWKGSWKRSNKTGNVRRFLSHNPIFLKEELGRVLGVDHHQTLENMVAALEVKRPATGIYTAPTVDSADPEVEQLVQQTGATRTSPDKLGMYSRKVAVQGAVKTAAALHLRPSAERLRSMRPKVFSRSEAQAYLDGEDPSSAIDQLLDKRVIETIHPGIYRRVKVADHGPEVLEWATRQSETMGAIARSIDESIMHHSVRDGPGAPAVIAMTLSPKPHGKTRDRIYVNFKRMGSIYAVGGGKGNRAIWNSDTAKTRLTKDAAEFLAEQIFGPRIGYGDLMAMTEAHRLNPDKSPGGGTLPAFRERGYMDYSPRIGEDSGGARLTILRRKREAETMFKTPCILYVDDREDRRIIDALHGIENLEVVVARLEVGDFHARWGVEPEKQVIIERKTADDFEKSIRDQRLAEQILRMERKIQEGTPCYLLQQGNPYAWSTIRVDSAGRVPEVAVTSGKKVATFVGLAVTDIRVVPVETWQTAAKAIRDIVLYSMDRDLLRGMLNPRTTRTVEEGRCASQVNIAAGPPVGPS